MTAYSIEDYRAHNEDAPIELVRQSEEWKPVIRLIDAWAKEQLGSSSGYSSKEIDKLSWDQGVRFPPLLREWWRLAGHHPFVKPGLLADNAVFVAPHQKGWTLHRDFFAIVVDDMQTQTCNGIHFDFLSDSDPEVYGLHGFIGPEDDPSLNWYKRRFIATGLRVPSLIFTTLLYHLTESGPSVRDEAIYLEIERKEPRGRELEERLISKLGLKHFPNKTLVGDIYSDGEDIIYYRLRGCACRTAEAAERVCWAVPAHPRRR